MAATATKLITGRRKEAVARVRLVPDTGAFVDNGRAIDDYFPTRVHRMVARAPLTLLERERDYDVITTIRGAASVAKPARSGWASPGPSSSSTQSCEPN